MPTDNAPKPCQWRGGNDFMECATCGQEFDWRKEPKPDCKAPELPPE